jgi:hypothetical protein
MRICICSPAPSFSHPIQKLGSNFRTPDPAQTISAPHLLQIIPAASALLDSIGHICSRSLLPVISTPPCCPMPAPSSPPSSDSLIRHRLLAAGSIPLAPSLVLLRQLPILHRQGYSQYNNYSCVTRPLVGGAQRWGPFWPPYVSCPMEEERRRAWLRDCKENVLGLSLLLYSFNLPRKSSYSRCLRSRFSRFCFWSSGEKRLKSSPSLGVTLDGGSGESE